MPSWWCGPTYNERFCGVLPSSASCARSITQCRPTCSRHWWSALGLLVWSMAIVSWLAFQSTWSDDSSQCWTRLRSWPIICGNPTTSPTRWPASIVCTSLRELRSHSWHTKSSTDLRWSASALSHVADLTQSPIAAFCCFQSPGSGLSTVHLVAELLRSPACSLGMTSRKKWHQQTIGNILSPPQDTPVQEIFFLKSF